MIVRIIRGAAKLQENSLRWRCKYPPLFRGFALLRMIKAAAKLPESQ
jgi:hypothetical protein